MYIYLICSVRDADEESKRIADEYVAKLEAGGHRVHYPPRDVDQNSETGMEIVEAHLQAMKECDEVHILWNPKSSGSHMDLGMAIALDKKLVPVQITGEDNEGKSYWKVMNLWNDRKTGDRRRISGVERIATSVKDTPRMLEEAVKMARHDALFRFGIDEYGHSSKVDEWERSCCSVELRLLDMCISGGMGGWYHTFTFEAWCEIYEEED